MNDTVSMKTPTTLPHFSHCYRVIVLFVDNIDNIGDNTGWAGGVRESIDPRGCK